MNENKELIVPYDLNALRMGTIMLTGLIAFFLLMFWASSYFYILLGTYFTRVFQIAWGFVIGTLGVTLLYTVWFVWVNDNPAAILDPEGIWVNRFNFIPWDDIQSCQVFVNPGTPIETVCFTVKDSKKLFKNASIGGKITILWSKLFNYPPILLSGIAVANDDVISFAQAHLKETE